MRRIAIITTAAALGLPMSAAPAAADPVLNGTFLVSGVDSNNQIAPGPGATMWVTLDAAGKDVASIAQDGTVTEYNSPNMSSPVGITADANGKLWVTQPGGVASFSPGDPNAAVPTSIGDIGTAQGITLGPDGNLWTASADKVIRIPPGNPADFKTFPLTGVTNARDITAGTDALWVADFNNQVVRVATDGTGQAFATGGGLQGVAAGPGGQVAYAQQGSAPHYIGRLTATTAEQKTPVPLTDPFGVTFAADGAYWVAQFATNSLGRLTPDGAYSTLPMPANSGPRQIATGPGDTVWVTLDNTEQVARVSGVSAPPPGGRTGGNGGTGANGGSGVAPAPTTELTKKPKRVKRTAARKAKVTFRFTGTAGATFQCRVDKRAWRTCTPPKSYRLKPGKHRFAVRAVLNGTRDTSPATYRFRVKRTR
jgi:streptogramin lyase